MSACPRIALVPLLAALAAACVPAPRSTPAVPDRPAATPAPAARPAEPPATAVGLGVTPAAVTLPADAAPALAAFVTSCPALLKRTDRSGLTRTDDWRPACAAAPGWAPADAAGFFTQFFEGATVGDGRAFATGYYEPEIAGSRTRRAGYDTPAYRRPPDLVEADLGQFAESLKGRRIRGRIEKGALVPYPDRAAIEDGALAGRGLEIAWAADPVELFFLEVQGSGRLRLPDGGVMRLGYDGQNGRDYTAIGRLLRERGLLPTGGATMQGIIDWVRANPAEGRALMRENRSYVFFRELTGPGPIGAMGVAVAPRATVAADPAFVPLGAPLLLALDRAEASGLWVAQDTGGAIKGANRVDTFWGAGDAARTTAGGMSASGRATLLLPRGTLARLSAGR